ncbi:MAG: amidohydrolase [Paracoccaceae bacterium]
MDRGLMLTNADIVQLTDWRHALHRAPELSGHEENTARMVTAALAPTNPDQIITGLGGHGVAAIYQSPNPGPIVMIRAELDALPITELTNLAHSSQIPGHGHLCGHDGHMTILHGLARLLGRRRPATGRVILLFQPAEEDGSGAAAVIADPRFATLATDWAFALHNYPGLPFGHAMLAAGPANCASMGLKIGLTGKTAHASQPQTGLSPALAIATLIPALNALGQGGALAPDYRLVTLTHARIGEPAFGIAPGYGELWATLRTLTDDGMAGLISAAETLARTTADAHGLSLSLGHHDHFHACFNHPQATAHLQHALQAERISLAPSTLPMRASEDFGRFGATAKSAMVFLGAGDTHPALHNPDYDYPDALTPIGIRIFLRVITDLLG